MLIAASTDSEPVERKNDLHSGRGRIAANCVARSTTGGHSSVLFRWSSSEMYWDMVAAISGWPWPRLALIWPDVKSMISRPASS